MSEDWRLVNQEQYLRNKKLRKKDFPEGYDHAHCAFCWEKFGKGYLTAGYCTSDEQHWICEQCFEDFKERFGWRVVGSHDSKKMNFYNIQILSSVIPYHSTIFVTVVTMIQLTRKKASFQMWLLFMLFFLGSAFVANILGGLLGNWHGVSRVIVEALVYAFGNYGMVMLQKKAAGKK